MTSVEQEHRVRVVEDDSEGSDAEVRWWWKCSCGESDETKHERAHAEAAGSAHGDLVESD